MRFSLAIGRRCVCFVASMCLVTPGFGRVAQGQQFQSPTKGGAVLGGLAGAIIGGIAGNQNDETVGGVAIGGAVGALAGGLLGKAEGQAQVQEYQYQQQVQQAYQERVSRAVSMQDIVALTQSGVSPTLVIKQIRQHGVTHRLEVNDIIELHRNGVSEPIIVAMQDARLASAPEMQVATRPVLVPVVSRPIYVQPAPPVARIQFYHHNNYRAHRPPHHRGR